MIGVVVTSHGRLADELLLTTVFIVGKTEQMVALSIDPSKPIDKLQSDIRKAVKEVDTGDGVLILTDMFGGTPANMSLAFLEDNKVEVITGVNLPMLIKLCQCRNKNKTLHEVADELVDYCRKSINQATAILKK
ncbi:MAG: PTS sugar transporter subunit IIA [Deltaproteobacteria bacterium]|nr:PTS sugar transporter subunit IIA [Deltaproteobacteria bacterium]MBW1719021.1 PTS sugar transporter subunit IIA [Deltaproteobacteria bacterium]MBW1932442.1 PTS sugar transporter subunit IIA [Deltaproteobacteria bacterium]MBW1937785.1 PTS sugar transporter subunit IIA [Deltaproteobacteria bacterium]MBW1963920.1 PTS sugar transporter subunit IIA [Deltaproteobacteria bacterium]